MPKKISIKNVKNITNGAESIIQLSHPYIISVSITGISDFLFHRWNCESVEAKNNAAKNSAAKKTDDIESFVYRDDKGFLCVPGEYIRQAVIHAAKYRQDPRSPRKSAMDMYKAGVVPLTALCTLGKKKWDYEDRRRVVIQRNAISRTRPAMKLGYELKCDFLINLPEYISPSDFCSVLNDAGRLIGIGDFRPTFGRFTVSGFKVIEN